MKTKKMIAYSYYRFSSKEQAKGDSLRRQNALAEDWCQRNQVELVENYSDLGVSAYHGRNSSVGDLARFLKLVRSGRIPQGAYFLIENLDRLSRDEVMEAMGLFQELIKAGVRMVTLSDGVCYDKESISKNWTTLIIALASMARAHEESARKGQMVADAWEIKRQQIANGVKMTKVCPAWLRLAEDRKAYLPIPERVAVIRRIFTLFAGGKGKRTISDMFNREGVPPFPSQGRVGRGWYTSYVTRLLRDRRLIGEFAPGIVRNRRVVAKREVVKDYYPTIVDRGLFASVQEIIKSRTCERGRSTYSVFSRLAWDKATGSAMNYVNKRRDKGHHYLVPYSAIMRLSPYECWNYDQFLDAFLAVCAEAALEKREPETQDNGLAIQREELADVVEQINRVADYLASGLQSFAVITGKLEALHRSKADLERKIADLENQALAKPQSVAEIDWSDSQSLKENLQVTVKRITVDAKKRWFRVEFLSGAVYEYTELPDGDRRIDQVGVKRVGKG